LSERERHVDAEEQPVNRIILTHEHTDFDGLASLLAAAKLHPGATPVLPQQLNRNLREFLSVYWDALPFARREELPRRRIDEVILVDTQTASPIKGMTERARLHIVDHHPLAVALREGDTYSGEALGATTTLLLEEVRQRAIALSPIEATLLLLGIYEDTGSLTYTTTTARDAHAAAWLLDRGASLDVLNQYLHRPLTEEQMEVYSRLVEQGETLRIQGYAVLVAAITLNEYVEELSTLAHKVNDLLDPDASFMLFAHGPDVQLIARSATEAIDVGEVARHFGGGGHSKAAAAVLQDAPLEEAKARLLDWLQNAIRPPVTVRDIMSFGVHTLRPETSIQEAEREAQKYGHEGFPVLDNGQLVGVITRREIERALYHNLAKSPIRRYMRKGDIRVGPDDRVERVPEVMTQYDVGQVPVVQDGKVLGIVTRTDLVKLMAPLHHSSRQEISSRLEHALPAPRRELIIKARDVANALGYSLYVVGGFVRDLLLGIPDLDLDLVVEGDAIQVAQELARQVGGRVTSHRRFGTAKLLLRGTTGTNLPESLDLATSRIEFYAPDRPTLPWVEGSSIKEDLRRRDFTINTLAICLDQGRYGELLDHFGGVQDLEAGLIRVLHNFSFIEDPTRILRAVRLEQRLGFRIEPQTEQRIREDVERLSRVTGQRIRNELALTFQEEEPEKSWRRLADLRALPQIHPALVDDDWLQSKFAELRQQWRAWPARAGNREGAAPRGGEPPPERPGPILYWGLITCRMAPGELASLLGRIKIGSREAKCLDEVAELMGALPALRDPELPLSRLYNLLRPLSEEALLVVYTAWDDPQARAHLELYAQRLRWVRPHVDGSYLKQLGLKPGPIYKQILTEVHDAVLNGQVRTRAEEEALAQELAKKAW